jgi:hypothetical protein
MDWNAAAVVRRLFDPECGASMRLLARWIFLRALGVIYFSAFFSLLLQVRGLIGPDGILPSGEYLQSASRMAGQGRFWFAPTLLWISSSNHMLLGLCWVGMFAAALVICNIYPRLALAVCLVCFLSLVTAASEFAGYQSDGMLLEAGFLALFLAPGGWRPGMARTHPPMLASVLLLLWEWFRIYFGSGVAKIASGDEQWRQFTAMDEYYQNGPLPTWIGWYVQHFPHWFHAATAFGTLALELVLVWMVFLPRRFRMVLFFIVTPWQMGIILTANYTFLNYLVLFLGIFLLDDRFLARFLPVRWRERFRAPPRASLAPNAAPTGNTAPAALVVAPPVVAAPFDASLATPAPLTLEGTEIHTPQQSAKGPSPFSHLKIAFAAIVLVWLFYASTVPLLGMIRPGLPFPSAPVVALEPFRIADRYGLFAVMTRGRYEIEFQGSADGTNWVAYPFRFKPQDPAKAPGIYAPYQPRFDWNLWFASLGAWRENPMVPRTEVLLLKNDADVLALFAGNPFAHEPPRQVRAVLWQYWFTTPAEKRATGAWWRREYLGLYAPTLERESDGKITVMQWPETAEPRE